MNDNHNQATDGEAKAKPEVIKLGLDLHARQVELVAEARRGDRDAGEAGVGRLQRLHEVAAVGGGGCPANGGPGCSTEGQSAPPDSWLK